MTKLLFICHGNICRSPMAEYAMRDMVEKAGLSAKYQIASAATSREELGNPVYPPARRKLEEHGINCAGHAARQLVRADYERWDYLIGMDSANRRNMQRLFGGDPAGKISLLLEWVKETPAKACPLTGREGARERSQFSPQAETEKSGLCSDDVADPWYTGDFEATWRDVQRGCRAILETLEKRE